MPIPHIHFVYGFLESAKSDGHGLAALEKRMIDAGWTVGVSGYDGDVVAAIKQNLPPFTPLILVGHSFGGAKAVEVSAELPPVEHLFLLNAVPYRFPWSFIPSPSAFKLPASVKAATAWWRKSWLPPWECPIRSASCPYANNVTKDSHSGICGDTVLQGQIFDVVRKIANGEI